MTRKIKLSDLKAAIDEAYEQFKNDNEGEPDARVSEVAPDTFGISVMLTDGTVISKGDAKAPVAIGDAAKMAVATILLSQNTPDQLMQKSGKCPCAGPQGPKPQIPFSSHGIRAVSAIEPTGDPEGKWDIIINRAIDLMGSAPELDDKLFETLKKQALDAGVENAIAAAEFFLYDDAPIAINTWLKATAMKATAEQLATMGATIAADGVNPATGKHVFDGAIAPNVTGLMAAQGPRKARMPWLMATGLPAKSGFGGCLVGTLPGVMGIAAVAPRVNCAGISVKAMKAVKYIVTKLQLNAFGSAAIEIVNE